MGTLPQELYLSKERYTQFYDNCSESPFYRDKTFKHNFSFLRNWASRLRKQKRPREHDFSSFAAYRLPFLSEDTVWY